MTFCTPSLPGSSQQDSPSLTGWGIAALSGAQENAMTPYARLLLDPRWQKKRLHCLEAAGWACNRCFATDRTLHVHHRYYVKGRKPWEYEGSELEVLCAECHSSNHELEALRDRLLLLCDDCWHPPSIAGFLAGLAAPSYDQSNPAALEVIKQGRKAGSEWDFMAGVFVHMLAMLGREDIAEILTFAESKYPFTKPEVVTEVVAETCRA